MSIKARIVVGFACVIALMALVAGLVAVKLASVERLATRITSEINSQIRSADAAAEAIANSSNGLRAYILTGDARYRTSYRKASAECDTAVSRLQRDLSEPAENEALAELQAQLTQLQSEAQRAVELADEGRRPQAYQRYQEKVQPAANSATALATRIGALGHDRVSKLGIAFERQREDLDKFTLGTLMAAVLLSAVFVTATAGAISHPARSIAAAAKSISKSNYQEAMGLLKRAWRNCANDDGTASPGNELGQIALALSEMSTILEIREKSLAALAEVRGTCASTFDLAELLDQVVGTVARHSGAVGAIIYLIGPDGMNVGSAYGIPRNVAEVHGRDPGGYPAQAVAARKPIVVNDIPPDADYFVEPGLGKLAPRAVACIPMLFESEPFGVIVLASLRSFPEEVIRLLQDIGLQLAIAVSNAAQHTQLREMAETLEAMNEELSRQNEQLQQQNEEMQVQSEEIEVQNEELLSQTAELQQQNADLDLLTKELSALQSVTAVALSAVGQDQLLEGLLEAVCQALYLQFGLVLLTDESGNELRAQVGHNVGDVAIPNVAVGVGLAGQVAQMREVLSCTDAREELSRLGLTRLVDASLIVGLPLQTGDSLRGVALLGSSEPREFNEREEHLLRVFSERAAVAIERAQSYRQLEDAERKARAERERLQAIIDDLPEGVVIAHAPDGRVEMANKAALELYGLSEAPEVPVTEHAHAFNIRLADGSPCRGEDLPLSRSLLRDEQCVGIELLIRQPHGRDVVVLANTKPIKDQSGKTTGAIGVFRDITSIKEHQHLLEEVYERERKIAETLQKTFLPSLPGEVDGYEIGHLYIPAQQGAQVGGDFYDLIELGNNALGVVMGDVSGKGVGAAVHTAMAKYMIRGFAFENPEPAEVLRRVNDAMARYIPPGVFVTLFYGILYTDERRLIYANAGHELPLFVRSYNGECVRLTSTGPAAGVIPRARYSQEEMLLADGDAFVLYTDGVTEARRGKQFLGCEGLENLVTGISDSSAGEMAHRILAGVRDFSQDNISDDIALVVIKPMPRNT